MTLPEIRELLRANKGASDIHDIASELLSMYDHKENARRLLYEDRDNQKLKHEAELDELNGKIALLYRDIGFYKCCALSGETPEEGSQPSVKENEKNSACKDAREHAKQNLTGFDKVAKELDKLRSKDKDK